MLLLFVHLMFVSAKQLWVAIRGLENISLLSTVYFFVSILLSVSWIWVLKARLLHLGKHKELMISLCVDCNL